MLKKFVFTGTVKRTVVDTITVAIYDEDEKSAKTKAKDVLESFPKPCIKDANYCYIENREQENVEVLDIQ